MIVSTSDLFLLFSSPVFSLLSSDRLRALPYCVQSPSKATHVTSRQSPFSFVRARRVPGRSSRSQQCRQRGSDGKTSGGERRGGGERTRSKRQCSSSPPMACGTSCARKLWSRYCRRWSPRPWSSAEAGSALKQVFFLFFCRSCQWHSLQCTFLTVPRAGCLLSDLALFPDHRKGPQEWTVSLCSASSCSQGSWVHGRHHNSRPPFHPVKEIQAAKSSIGNHRSTLRPTTMCANCSQVRNMPHSNPGEKYHALCTEVPHKAPH